jgi:hypothetical protein
MTITMPSQNKRKGVQIEIRHAVRHCVEVAYIKVITRRSTTKEATEEGGLRVLQLVLLAAQQIASGSLNVHN